MNDSKSTVNTATTSSKSFKRERKLPPVWLPGELSVVTRNGKRGSFNIATLYTGMGEFAVKDRALEQYECGVYKGNFLVSNIIAESNAWKNSIFVQARAFIDDYDIIVEDVSENSDGSEGQSIAVIASVPDIPDEMPNDHNESSKPATTIAEAKAKAMVMKGLTEPTADDEKVELVALGFVCDFDLQPSVVDPETGEVEHNQILAIKYRQPVALDTNGLERALLTRQRDYLKSLGYKFNSALQIWAIPE